MCDTVVVVREGEVLFGKNSDRDPNEAQRVEWHPRRAHAPGTLLRCTWTALPQVRETHAVVLSRPYWMWGAEMGANEHGVVIGNEAVFTLGARRGETGLLGMDLVRLALERAASAEEAVSVLRALVAEHGQAGRSGYDDPAFCYDSSFLVADARGAWLVETAGRETATERVERGARAISNGLTIGTFARRWSDPLRSRVAEHRARRGRVESLAAGARGPRDIAGTLRDHGASGLRYRLLNGAMASPCMHAGGLVASSQTVASWVSRLTPGGAEHFVTATAAPCLSGFKPIDLHAPLDLGEPTGVDDGVSHFWKAERLHRALVGDPKRSEEMRRARDAWEEPTWRGGRDPAEAFRSFDALVTASLESAAGERDLRPLHARLYWRRRHSEARAATPKLPAR